MKTIVITGSTRGIGYALACAFLARQCQVVVSGRTQSTVDSVVTALETQFATHRVVGQACDVTEYEQVQALWDFAQDAFGKVDIWLNNAALSAPTQDFWLHAPDTITAVTETNITGTMNGCRVAINGMLAQGHGHIFTFEGLGSHGEMVGGSSLYGTSKYALTYFTKTLVRELGNLEGIPVKVSTIAPGMALTDLFLTSVPDGREQFAKRFFNILGDRPETIGPKLAERILAHDSHGGKVSYLNRWEVMWRFLRAPFNQRDIVGDLFIAEPNPADQTRS